ncbi:17064_t:CDS:2 [Funneliformis caledonium]|uniref:non-specific serine/threonine protein kinase n=1 Tax=Funneliformis caledonium TaxID=1117310 RepID=A0A9N9NJI0_9GLOM|nr:17064_t:CDS:2 [Funneliformis caledonium]
MATYEEIKQELTKADARLDEYKGVKLNELEDELMKGEYNEKQEKRLEKRIDELKEEKKRLVKDMDDWKGQAVKLQNALVAFGGGEGAIKRKAIEVDEIDQVNYFKRLKDASPPSAYARRGDRGWPSGQCGNNPLYLNHRPKAASGNPIAIYHPVFETFVQDCQTAVPTDEVYKFVLELTEEMSDPFPDEDARINAFHHLLETIGIKLNKIVITNCTTDGSVLTKDGSMLVINLEVKPELGEGNGCPYIQDITYYGKKVADYLEGREALRLPCFVLYLAGPFLGIAGVIHTKNKIVADPLVGPLPLMFLQYDREQMTQIARMFTALKSAHNTLYKYYDENLETGPQSLWPYCHSFYYQTKKVEFEYIQQLESTKLLFIVKTKQSNDNIDLPQRLLVKFTETYGVSVHQFCAAHGFAPKFFGCQQLSQRWKIIVMEYLDDYVNLYNVVSAKVDWGIVTKKITEIVKQIYDAGYVHGDLRKVNILYREGKDRSVNLALVDFNWADQIGKAVYPPFLNT